MPIILEDVQYIILILVSSIRLRMKLIVLTSSIFYLLGLKLTHEVQLQQPFTTDTVKITAPAELSKLPEAKPDNKFSLTKANATDSIKTYGSGGNTAPWYPLPEESK